MNRTIAALAFCALLFVGPTGCSPAERASSPPDRIYAEGSIVTPGAGMSRSEFAAAAEGDSSALEDRIFLPEAPSYRGNVTDISQENGIYELRLEQADGTDYGYFSITLHTSGGDYEGIDFSSVAPGDYLEVFYSDRNNGLPPIIVAANKLPASADCVFNGELEQIEGEAEGILRMRERDTAQTVVFHYDDTTLFFADPSQLAPGDMLNIFHSGALTRSIPPQGFALEVRRLNPANG